MKAVNPATGESFAEYDGHDENELERRLARAEQAFQTWRDRDFEYRAERMRALADHLRANRHKYGGLMTREMGKPIEQATGEVDKCAWVCEHYADRAASYLEATNIETDADRSRVQYDPLGPVLAIMPWNFPFWQVFRFAAPNVMAGNVGLLKHAPNVPGCAEALEEMFRESGFPAGLFQHLAIDEKTTGRVIEDDRTQAVTLTGSTGAGRAVAEQAGAALKKCVLELGGSDPFIVLADADVDEASDQAVYARTQNNGQSCIAAKRFIVVDEVYDDFVDGLVERFEALEVGDPTDPSVDVGPMARSDLRETLHRQVTESTEQGARCRVGGELPDGPGYYYPPTVLTDVDAEMTVMQEETFGPVAAVARVQTPEEAVALANDTDYGLGASIWTADVDRAEQFVGQIRAGHVAVNGMVKSDPRLPFGGIKASGFGRELARDGILEFVNRKTVWISED
jgi:succinate-semialdehyde dehydrogenase/glutarate-semialdehyde dehydrogenase